MSVNKVKNRQESLVATQMRQHYQRTPVAPGPFKNENDA
jgi:hypothetical protein